MTPADWAGLKHFTPAEFKAPDKMGAEFMDWLDGVRTLCGFAFKITSSYRDPAYNATVGGARDSAHTDVPCNAVDLMPANHFERFKIIEAAMNTGCSRVGLYPNGSIHLDRTEDRRPSPRLWNVVDRPASRP